VNLIHKRPIGGSTQRELDFTAHSQQLRATEFCIQSLFPSTLAIKLNIHCHASGHRPSSCTKEVSNPSDEPPSSEDSSNSSTSIITFYKPPTLLSLLHTTAINLILPFINSIMLGFGETFTHELAFQWGWWGAKVFFSLGSLSWV